MHFYTVCINYKTIRDVHTSDNISVLMFIEYKCIQYIKKYLEYILFFKNTF